MQGSALTGWRKIASAVWDPPNDPQIYGQFEVDATQLSSFIAELHASGARVTPTHLMGRALARALVAVPTLNVRLLAGRAVPRERIEVFFITSVGAGHDLSGVKIGDVDKKSALDVARELDERASALRRGDDRAFGRSKRLLEHLPRLLLRVLLHAAIIVVGDHAKNLTSLGLSAMPFGSAMVSSVGMLGLPGGFTPLAWIYRVPVIVLVGEVTKKPVAVDDRVEIRPMLPITATIDHRYADGAEIAAALRAFRDYLEDPAAFEPALAPASGQVELRSGINVSPSFERSLPKVGT